MGFFLKPIWWVVVPTIYVPNMFIHIDVTYFESLKFEGRRWILKCNPFNILSNITLLIVGGKHFLMGTPSISPHTELELQWLIKLATWDNCSSCVRPWSKLVITMGQFFEDSKSLLTLLLYVCLAWKPMLLFNLENLMFRGHFVMNNNETIKILEFILYIFIPLMWRTLILGWNCVMGGWILQFLTLHILGKMSTTTFFYYHTRHFAKVWFEDLCQKSFQMSRL